MLSHFKGFPPKYFERVKRTIIVLTRNNLILIVVAFILAYGSLNNWSTTLHWLAPVSFALLAFHLLLVTPVSLIEILKVHLVPYFEKGKEKISADTFLSGKELARNCTILDEFLINAGAKPISAFGFADDLYQEELVWHCPKNGLESVTKLIEILRTNSQAFEKTEAVILELERIEKVLLEASERNIRFCFVLLHGSSFSGWEQTIRKGYF